MLELWTNAREDVSTILEIYWVPQEIESIFMECVLINLYLRAVWCLRPRSYFVHYWRLDQDTEMWQYQSYFLSPCCGGLTQIIPYYTAKTVTIFFWMSSTLFLTHFTFTILSRAGSQTFLSHLLTQYYHYHLSWGLLVLLLW